MSQSISEMLRDKDILLNSYAVGRHKTVCPECGHTRKDKKNPSLYVHIPNEEEAMWKCYNAGCGYSGQVNNKNNSRYQQRSNTPPKRSYKKPEYQVKEELAYPERVVKYFESRAISVETALRNKIEYSVRPGAKDGEMLFPYIHEGQVINVKHRWGGKKFRLEKDAQLIFFGLDDIKGRSEVIIVEGEFDKLALEEVGLRNVISVPNGATVIKKEDREKDADKANHRLSYLDHAADILEQKKRIILCTDQDEAGESLEYELARRLGRDKCFRVRLPRKDANDVLIHDGKDVLRDAILKAEPYPIKGLYSINDFEQSLVQYYQYGMQSGVDTGWSNVDPYYSIMGGRLTVVTGIPTSGKSEVIDALMVKLAQRHGWKHAIFSPEHEKEMHVAKLCEKIQGKSFSPKSKDRMTLEQFKIGAQWAHEYFHFIVNEAEEDDEAATIDWILDLAKAAVRRYGIKGFVIDPYNEIDHQRPKDMSETEYISQMLSKVKRFARLHDVHVWLVAHPAKMPTDKDGKIMVPTGYDISGSAHWVNKADNLLVVHRPDKGTKVELHFKKIKFKSEGAKGIATLQYNIASGTYHIPQEERTYTNDDGSTYKLSNYTEEERVDFEELPF